MTDTRGRRSTVSAEQKQAEIDLYLAGKSTMEIQQITGANASSVRTRLRRAGLLRSPKEALDLARANGKMIKATPALGAEIRKRIAAGELKCEIVKALSISYPTMYKAEQLLPGTATRKRKSKAAEVDTRIPYEVFKKMRDQQNNQSGASQ